MPRPFKSWASVYESDESVWTRVRGRLAGLLSRRRAPRSPSETTTANVDPVAPPDDFKFPWTRPQSIAPAATPADAFLSVDEALPTSSGRFRADAHQKWGFLSRLLKRQARRDNGEAHEQSVDAAARALDAASNAHLMSFERKPASARLSFDSVDDALPALDSLPLIELQPRTDEIEILPLDGSSVDTARVDVDTVEVEGRSIWDVIKGLFGAGGTAVESAEASESDTARTSAIFLLAKFRAFYNEIIRFQHQKSEFTAGFATAVMAHDGTDDGPAMAAEGLSKRLTELLELQAAEAKWMGGEAAQRYPDAQYAMAALADEMFSNMEWEGQAAWAGYSIEQKLYRTRAAELELFKRIDRLLRDAPDSVISRDLARVYLLVLAAGFRGKWRPFGLTRPIAEYRRRLFEYIHGSDPLLLYATERRVFPEIASRTLAGAAVARYSTAQRWAAILIFLVVSYTVVAHIAWSRASADLKDITMRIKSGSTVGAP